MKPKQLKALIQAAPKVFCWVQISEKHSAYLQITKSTLYEYLKQLSSKDQPTLGDPYLEVDNEGNLFVGCPSGSVD